jgi:hypothetical protein
MGNEAFTIDPKYKLRKVDWNFNEEPLGLLLMWEGPQSDHQYVIGVDTSEGLGQDRCAVEVNRVGTNQRSDEQVAEWCGNVNGLELAPILYSIGKLYTVSGNEPLMVIEVNRGDVVQMELRTKYDWSCFYQQRYYDKVRGGWSQRLGWNTNADTRPKMLARAIQQIKAYQWRINSPWLIDEISDFEYDAQRMKMKAAVNCHDDRVIAAFIALYCSSEISSFNNEVSTTMREDMNATLTKPTFQQMDVSADEVDADMHHMVYY